MADGKCMICGKPHHAGTCREMSDVSTEDLISVSTLTGAYSPTPRASISLDELKGRIERLEADMAELREQLEVVWVWLS